MLTQRLSDPIAIVVMPWAQPTQPCLMMGNIHARLATSGHVVHSFSFFLDFVEIVKTACDELGIQYSQSHYQAIMASTAACELIFGADLETWEGSDDLLPEDTPHIVRHLAPALARRAQDFVRTCSDELSRLVPASIIMVCHLHDTIMPSLMLAREVRRSGMPSRIILAGDRFEEPVGSALVANLEDVDEASGLDPDLNMDGMSSDTQSPHDLKVAPPPDFDEYFERLRCSPMAGYLTTAQWMPYDMSRGCWWAEISKCSFCALTGTDATFRSRKSSEVTDHLRYLMARHRQLRIMFADWIISPSGVEPLLEMLSPLPTDARFFIESRPSLTREDLRALSLRRFEVQFGIETLNSNLLSLMGKGTRVLSSIRALKCSVEVGLPVHWNLMYGHPGELPADLLAMKQTLPDLYHLPPPTLHRFRLRRWSPIFANPRAYGVTRIIPRPWHSAAFHWFPPEIQEKVANDFGFICDDRVSTHEDLRDLVDAWNTSWLGNGVTLWHERGPGFVRIHEDRQHRDRSIITLTNEQAELYNGIEYGTTLKRLSRAVLGNDEATNVNRAKRFCSELIQRGLVYREGDWVISLPVRLP